MDLEVEQVEDENDLIVVLVGHDKGTARHTHLSGDFRYSSFRVVKRPTERAAFKRVYGECDDDHEPLLPLMKAATHQRPRQCLSCLVRKADSDFDRDKRFPRGLAFYCKVCRAKTSRVSWRTRGLTRTPIL
jgi:hypothetical protein